MGAVKVSDSMRPVLVATKTASRVSGCSATKPSWPVAHHIADTLPPTPRPANQAAPERRKSALDKAHNTRAPPTTTAAPKPAWGKDQPHAADNQTGKAAPEPMSNTTLSTVPTRNTAVTPRMVAKAAMPITANTTTPLRLPPPMRTSVLLPQPDANTMPKPNSAPPNKADSQM